MDGAAQVVTEKGLRNSGRYVGYEGARELAAGLSGSLMQQVVLLHIRHAVARKPKH